MRVKASESVFATATGHHRDMVYVGIVDHRRECGVSVASGEPMPGVLFPKLNEILFLHRRNYRLWCWPQLFSQAGGSSVAKSRFHSSFDFRQMLPMRTEPKGIEI